MPTEARQVRFETFPEDCDKVAALSGFAKQSPNGCYDRSRFEWHGDRAFDDEDSARQYLQGLVGTDRDEAVLFRDVSMVVDDNRNRRRLVTLEGKRAERDRYWHANLPIRRGPDRNVTCPACGRTFPAYVAGESYSCPLCDPDGVRHDLMPRGVAMHLESLEHDIRLIQADIDAARARAIRMAPRRWLVKYEVPL